MLQVRNRIYAAAFSDGWVRENMPRDYLPRRLLRLGLAAIVLASVNIFGGFAVTARMLKMYQKKER